MEIRNEHKTRGPHLPWLFLFFFFFLDIKHAKFISKSELTWLWLGITLKLLLFPLLGSQEYLDPWLYSSLLLPFTAQPSAIPATLLKLLSAWRLLWLKREKPPTVPVGFFWEEEQPSASPASGHNVTNPCPQRREAGWVGLSNTMRTGIIDRHRTQARESHNYYSEGNIDHL